MSESDVGVIAQGFHCPHCKGFIKITVEGSQSEAIVEVDDEYIDYDDEPDANFPGNEYYRTMDDMNELIRTARYADAVPVVERNFHHLVNYAAERDKVDLEFPVMTRGIKVLAVMGARSLLSQMLQIVRNTPSLRNYSYDLERSLEDADIHDAIVEAVENNPGCLQPDVKVQINQADGRRVANLITYSENAGRITRSRVGRKILLNIP